MILHRPLDLTTWPRTTPDREFLAGWQSNIYAVAKTLEALRAMDRWGATSGEQYRGFAAIGATSHPDSGEVPDEEMFRRITEARDLLLKRTS